MIAEMMEPLIPQKEGLKLSKILCSRMGITDSKGRYLLWGKLKPLPPPEDYTSEELSLYFLISIIKVKP